MTRPIRNVPIHQLNKAVMATTDIEMLEAWLAEEKCDAKRQFAMRRIYHRISLLKRRRDLAEIDRISKE